MTRALAIAVPLSLAAWGAIAWATVNLLERF